MSSGTACQHRAEHFQHWVVTARYGNASAFNGYRWQRSDYSCIKCLVCEVSWRTKAAYVVHLKDAPPI